MFAHERPRGYKPKVLMPLARGPSLVTRRASRVALHRARQAQQNAFVESFNGRLRDELLNETLFTSLAHARQELANWMADYIQQRPHSGIGNLPP
jgi:transposase InsO family protein